MALTMLKVDPTLEQSIDRDLLEIKTSLFYPKIEFSTDVKKYNISTAKTRRDILDLIELRRHSFFHDFGMENLNTHDLFDEYDHRADHVILRDKESGTLIGCYRILHSDHTDKFYSQEQYEMNDFLRQPGTKIELSRACIHKNYRNGISLNLMWKGIAAYAVRSQAKYMFGCASVKSTSVRLAKSMFWNLFPGHFDSDKSVGVLPDYKTPELDDISDLLPFEMIEDHIPPLLKSYLRAGAKICSEPALDKKFRCFDFFTVLDLGQLNTQHKEKFFK